jgi:hypothetical protein
MSEMGKNGFVWFFGLVEDVEDPLQVGRVRVRCHGFHAISSAVLPKEDLPWAHVIMPVTSASYQEKGTSPTFLREGATVFGFFADGHAAQMPVIMGTLPGIPQPNPDFVDSSNIDQENHDVNKLARGINKLASIKEQVGLDEEFEIPPAATFGAQYPFNKVFESERGHVIEIDDTPGAERIHIFHNAGHYTERVQGLRTDKVNGDHIEISMRDRYIKVRGNMAVVVDGTTTVASTGALTLVSNTSITMSAPLINISSTLGTSVSGGAALTLGAAGITTVSGAGLFLNPGLG